MDRIRSKIPQSLIKRKVVFDAGTGKSSLEFIKSCNPQKVIAVTQSEHEIEEIREFDLDKNGNIELRVQDIGDENFELGEKVDVIFAGYFFSALQGDKPFETLNIMEKFKGFLNEEGAIIIEDFYWKQDLVEEEDILSKKMHNLKDGLKTILNISFPHQMPREYLQKLLEILGYKIDLTNEKEEGRGTYEAALKNHRNNLQGIKKYINMFEDSELKSGLTKYADEIMTDIEKIQKPSKIGSDFLIIATR